MFGSHRVDENSAVVFIADIAPDTQGVGIGFDEISEPDSLHSTLYRVRPGDQLVIPLCPAILHAICDLLFPGETGSISFTFRVSASIVKGFGSSANPSF